MRVPATLVLTLFSIATTQAHYYGVPGGDSMTDWRWLNPSNNPGWSVVGAADHNGDGFPDLIWQNDVTRQVTVHHYGGEAGSVFQGWAWLNSASTHGWSLVNSPRRR